MLQISKCNIQHTMYKDQDQTDAGKTSGKKIFELIWNLWNLNMQGL